MYSKQPTIYIGYDPRENLAFEALVESIIETSSVKNLNIIKLNQPSLRASGLYRRAWHTEKHSSGSVQKLDTVDKKPLSTDFSFSRFLVPHLNQHEGYAIFMDCDMMLRSDIMEVFEKYSNPNHALSCVWHQYTPKEGLKMDSQIQQPYTRKNWSSFMLWNCSHPVHTNLTVDDINTKSGWWLHNFSWTTGWEQGRPTQFPLGQLPEEWNWLDNHSPEYIEAKNVHFTTGGPWFDDWVPVREADKVYSKEWDSIKEKVVINEGLVNV